MKTKLILPVSAFVLILVFTACKKDDSDKGKCPADLICTEIFVTITVDVLDQQDNAVLLDSHRTVRQRDGFILLSRTPNDTPAYGYPVVTDTEIDFLTTTGDSLTFQGYKDGITVAKGSYYINHDCCHVNKQAGPDTLLADQ